MSPETGRRALDLFFPFFTKTYNLIFYGGEPLLRFPVLKTIVKLACERNRIFEKKARFSITTNGSLLDDDILDFLKEYSFHVELSFDGLAQNIQRKKNSFDNLVGLLKKLLGTPEIRLEVNSVFTPETVGLLADSMDFMIRLGIPRIRLSFSTIKGWDTGSQQKLQTELKKLEGILSAFYEENRFIPVLGYVKEDSTGIFTCMAGQDRLSVDCDGGVLGCDLFREYLIRNKNPSEIEKYSLGTLDELIPDPTGIFDRTSSHYARLTQDHFRSADKKCFLCSDLKYCGACPVNSFLSGGSLFDIPPFLCRLNRIRIRSKKRFWEKIHPGSS